MVTSHDGIRGPACPVKSVITQRALNQSYAFVVSRNFAEEATTGARWAMSAMSTPRAICTSPTAPPS